MAGDFITNTEGLVIILAVSGESFGKCLSLECAGRAQRRRRFGFPLTLKHWLIQSGVAVPMNRNSVTALQIKWSGNHRFLG